MAQYVVEVTATTTITYQVEADDEDDAREFYARLGEEVSVSDPEMNVEWVKPGIWTSPKNAFSDPTVEPERPVTASS